MDPMKKMMVGGSESRQDTKIDPALNPTQGRKIATGRGGWGRKWRRGRETWSRLDHQVNC